MKYEKTTIVFPKRSDNIITIAKTYERIKYQYKYRTKYVGIISRKNKTVTEEMERKKNRRPRVIVHLRGRQT